MLSLIHKILQKLPFKKAILLVGSILFDFVIQPWMEYAAILCTIPAISGIGIIVTISCYAARIGVTALWGAFSFILLGQKLEINSTFISSVIEQVPGVNILPMYTINTIYSIIKGK